jgi:hypothetical protein
MFASLHRDVEFACDALAGCARFVAMLTFRAMK